MYVCYANNKKIFSMIITQITIIVRGFVSMIVMLIARGYLSTNIMLKVKGFASMIIILKAKWFVSVYAEACLNLGNKC